MVHMNMFTLDRVTPKRGVGYASLRNICVVRTIRIESFKKLYLYQYETTKYAHEGNNYNNMKIPDKAQVQPNTVLTYLGQSDPCISVDLQRTPKVLWRPPIPKNLIDSHQWTINLGMIIPTSRQLTCQDSIFFNGRHMKNEVGTLQLAIYE